MAPFIEHLAETYQHEHVGTTINVQSSGIERGIRAAIDGVSEIGISSRDLDADESAQLDQAVIARDALAVIVHPANPVTNLDQAQVQAIFSGQIRSRDALGGPASPIVLVVREAEAFSIMSLMPQGAAAVLALGGPRLLAGWRVQPSWCWQTVHHHQHWDWTVQRCALDKWSIPIRRASIAINTRNRPGGRTGSRSPGSAVWLSFIVLYSRYWALSQPQRGFHRCIAYCGFVAG